MATTVFVSPGVYTSEKDISYITTQVGVTTLGLVGETTIGPAFQPIFISNYGEFQTFFGGLNNTLTPDTGSPQYELGYIAKSYLSQSNQLFVTRVLGFCGYDAGLSWGVVLDAAVDPATTATTATISNNPYITYTATTGGTIVNIASSDQLTQSLISNGSLASSLSFLGSAASGATGSISATYLKTGSSFSGISSTLKVNSLVLSGAVYHGIASGITTYYSGYSYTDVENKVVALLRSRGTVDPTLQIPNFYVTGATGLILDPAFTAATINPLGAFSISGVSTTTGAFDYTVSFDNTQKNYISRVLGRAPQDGKTAIFLEELYTNMFTYYNNAGMIKGIKMTLVNYNKSFDNYLTQYQPAVTPYVVSEYRGNKVVRLFRLWTIADGNSANEQIKISISNIQPDAQLFDVTIRSFYDTDAKPVVLESFSRCTMDPTATNFIGRVIGTLDGVYTSNSSYVLVELDSSSDTSDTFPAGFIGYPIRDYTQNGNGSIESPSIIYKTAYNPFENARKSYLGISDTTGIDTDLFEYKGVPNIDGLSLWTGLTHGFHMDVNASAATIDDVSIVINSSGGTYHPEFLFDTGDWQFTTDAGLAGGPYAQIYARKFTLAPYGGFDGWDAYRAGRSNTDGFILNGTSGIAGLISGSFVNRALSNGDSGLSSDYYAFLEAMWTFQNPESVNINVFATPGIDTFNNTGLIQAGIDMIEQDRADSLYIVTTPDTDGSGSILTPANAVESLENQFDSNYTATYWPWIQINDAENNVYIFVPPTRDVVRNIALTDNIAFPWFAVAGVNRGVVDCIKARYNPTQSDRDTLYTGRINPIASINGNINIWGNLTLQVADSALNRINVRRLLLQTRKLIAAVSVRLLFEQDDTTLRNQFLSLVNPILDNIRTERGLTDFRVTVSSSPEDIDNNTLSGKIFLKPTRALEFIELEFDILPTGASFTDI